MTPLLVFKRFCLSVFLLLLCVQFYNPCLSQTIVNRDNPNEKIFLVRTKQFNEFLDRFNNKTNFKGDPVDSAFMAKIPRDKMLNSLFDLKDPRIDPIGKNFSENYVSAKTEFISEVIHKNLLINKYSEKIIAEAKSRVIYKGIPYKISILLNQEKVGKDMIKWVIKNVKGDLFNFLKTDTVYVRFIPPSSNETDFINLKRALEDIDYLQYYTSKDYTPDYLTVFFYMLNSGTVKFEYVEEVNYQITDLPGWCIKVKDFNRNEMNSGWLISDIFKNTH
ncbi:MAG: hypothetical protein EPN88_08040 [Bacteroidetes bacterium]|nr:MAG: hypothetical protein EPN88_08040 [Bacteroidota bacterium]